MKQIDERWLLLYFGNVCLSTSTRVRVVYIYMPHILLYIWPALRACEERNKSERIDNSLVRRLLFSWIFAENKKPLNTVYRMEYTLRRTHANKRKHTRTSRWMRNIAFHLCWCRQYGLAKLVLHIYCYLRLCVCVYCAFWTQHNFARSFQCTSNIRTHAHTHTLYVLNGIYFD